MSVSSRRHLFRIVGIALVAAGALPGLAIAQDARRLEVAGGYASLRDYDGNATFPRGWFVSGGADVAGPLAIAGDAGGSYKSMGGLDVKVSVRIHAVMAGPRIVWRDHRVAPYAQALFGVARIATTFTVPGERLSDAQNHFAIAPGGGIDIRVSDYGAIRVGASMRFIRSQTYTLTGTEPFTFREFQFIAGVVIR